MFRSYGELEHSRQKELRTAALPVTEVDWNIQDALCCRQEARDATPCVQESQEQGSTASGAGEAYCQHLIDSLIAPHLDTSLPDVKSTLHRAFGEVLTNVENRIKAIFTRCVQTGDTTPADPGKFVEEFQNRLRYIEDYLSATFQTRNVNYLYSRMDTEEPVSSGPQWRRAMRAMGRIQRQLHEELDMTGSSLLDGLVQHRLVTDAEQESILARPTRRAKAAELLRAVAPRLDQQRLQQEFLPLLKEDHQHLAEGLSRAIEEEEEMGESEGKCCVCQFHEEVEVKRLVPQLRGIVPSLHSDLSNPALSNANKMFQLKQQLEPDQIIASLRESYPFLYSQFCSERVTTLTCCCATLRGEQASIVLDASEGCSVTDEDFDVGRLSDLQSMIGDDLKERAYHLGSGTKGICLIINNMTYDVVRMRPRVGSELDVKNVRELFQQFGFSISEHQDLTAQGILDVLEQVANQDHRDFDSFVCFVLAHGDTDQIFGVDGSEISVKDMVASFHATKCVTLAGKPKLFFIQASRGKTFPAALLSEGKEDGICAKDADIFVGYSSTKEHQSFRNITQGAWYINALIEVLNKYGEKYDFQTCMTMVTELVSRKIHPHKQVSQTPEWVSTLRKPLFLSRELTMTTPAPHFTTAMETSESD